MAYEKGGYADKLGNRFETRWVVLQYLQVLAGELVSVYHEPIGLDEEGVDLWIVDNEGIREAQQCKGELAAKSGWSMADLNAVGILKHLRRQLERDDIHRFTLVSSTPATMLRDLSRSARDSTGDPHSFYHLQIQKRSKEHRDAFADFCKYFSLDPSNKDHLLIVFDLLKRSGFHQYSDDADTRRTLKTLACLLVDGDADNVLASLAEFSSENIRRTIHASELLKHLSAKGFRAKDLARDERLVPCIEELRRQFDSSMRGHLAGGRLLARDETQQALKWLQAKESHQVLLLHGRAGAGKSGVLLELIEQLKANDVPYLPLRLDRQSPRSTQRKYGEDLGLPESPVACLRAIASSRMSVLILDQLDALRWTSSHAASSLPICEEILQQAMTIRNMRVVVTCRTFDLTQDPRLKVWNNKEAARIEVGLLSNATVHEFVSSCGHDYNALSPREMSLLSTVHNLTMWAELARGLELPRFATASQLTKLFWRSRQTALAERKVEWGAAEKVLRTLSNYMDRTGRLSAPERLVEMHSRELAELQSLNVIQVEAAQVSFCHQAYFDYLVARDLLTEIDLGSHSLMNWLGVSSPYWLLRWITSLLSRLGSRWRGERIRQSLFRREQLRLVLTMLRDDDPKRFLAALKELVSEQRIRFHLKHLTLQVLTQGTDPRDGEVEFADSLLSDKTWRTHFIEQLIHADHSWFLALHKRGLWASWLDSSDEDLINHALWAVRAYTAKCGDEIAELLRPYILREGDWPQRCLYILPRLAEDEPDSLFKIRLALCKKGFHDPWVDWEGHVNRRPKETIKLVASYLTQAIKDFRSSDHDDHRRNSILESLKYLSGNKRNKFIDIGRSFPKLAWSKLFPLVQQFIAIRRRAKKQYHRQERNLRGWASREFARLPTIVRLLVIRAGRVLVQSEPDAFFRRLHAINNRSNRSIERLLLRTLLGADCDRADEVLKWFFAKPSRLRMGTRSSGQPWEPARRLIQRFALECSDSVYRQLEEHILSYHDRDERYSIRLKCEQAKDGLHCLTNSFGQTQYHLLPALPNCRKSPQAKGLEGVLQTKFGKDAKSFWPKDHGPKVGYVGSSIPRERLPYLSDNAWLRLIVASLPSRRPFQREWHDGRFTESTVAMFARDLEYITRREPSRFARLSLKIPATANPAYLEHILTGLQYDSPPDDLTDEVKQAWTPATAVELEDVVQRAHLKIRMEHAQTFCRLVRQRAEADWSDTAIDHVIAIARSHLHPGPDDIAVYEANRDASEVLEVNSLNLTRAVAAGTVESLLWNHPEWTDKLQTAVESLVADPNPAVRVAGIGACLPIISIDRDKAISWVVKACSHQYDPILACRNTRKVLAYAARTHFDDIVLILERMLVSKFPGVRRWGAAHATACWIVHGKMRTQLDQCLRGDDEMRVGVAMAARDLVGDNRYSKRCLPLLKPCLFDANDKVRHQVTRIFYEHELSCFDGDPTFLKTYASQTFHKDPSALLHALKNYTGNLLPLASVILKMNDVFAGPLAVSSRDVSTSIAGDAQQIAPILLRLYEQAEESGISRIQARCLDAWDALLQNRVGNVAVIMQEFAG